MSNVKEKEDWVDSDLLRLIRERDAEKALAEELNSEAHRNEFKRLRKLVKVNTIRAKRICVKNKIENLDPNSRNYWAELNKIAPVGKKGSREESSIISLENEDGTLIKESETADFINEFFTSIGPKLSKKITFPNNLYIETCKMRSTLSVMHEWDAITESEVELLVKDLVIHRGSNITELSSKLLKECLLCTVSELTWLFNLICTTRIFPDKWKEATSADPQRRLKKQSR